MKELFLENHYFEDSIKEMIIKEAIIIFDTNALLNLYLYTEKNRKKFFEILEHREVKEKLWMPYQVACEIYSNRESKRYEIEKSRMNLINKCRGAFKGLENILNGNDFKRLRERDKDAFEKIEKKSNEMNEAFINEIKKNIEILKINENKDEILNKINNIYESRVLKKPSKEYIEKLEEDGKKRYEKKIAPGYEDKNKLNNKYGDFFIWREIIDLAKEKKKNIVFISDDAKEDWRHEVNEKSCGAKKELLKEFKEETEGQLFFLWESEEFIKNYGTHYEIKKIDSLQKETKGITIDKIEIKDIDLLEGINSVAKENTTFKESFLHYYKKNLEIVKCKKNLERVNNELLEIGTLRRYGKESEIEIEIMDRKLNYLRNKKEQLERKIQMLQNFV